jgi:thiol:disulfide interchange protein DsbA
MKAFARFLLPLLLALPTAAPAPAAEGAKWQAGTSYALIDPPQPTATGGRIEVLEVFSYACPHCAHFQPYAEQLEARLPANARFELMPADFQPRWVLFARGFYTAKALGLVEATHQAMFDAIYRDRRPLDTLEQIAAFYAEHGADEAAFLSTARSFVVDGDLAKMSAREIAYGVDSTPTLIVAGKYRIAADPDHGIGYDEMVEIALHLVAEEARAAKR